MSPTRVIVGQNLDLSGIPPFFGGFRHLTQTGYLRAFELLNQVVIEARHKCFRICKKWHMYSDTLSSYFHFLYKIFFFEFLFNQIQVILCLASYHTHVVYVTFNP